MKITNELLCAFALVGLASGICAAQTPTAAPTVTPASGMITTEGISGDVDKKRREPVLSVRPAPGPDSATIYADAYVVNDDFKKYPIQFDFYVNRALFATQIRSMELPGPVGITVSYAVAPIPFNYTVTAKVLHPNRTFTTVLNGSVESINPTPQPGTTYDCTYTEQTAGGSAAYENTDAPCVESSGQITCTFTAGKTDDSSTSVNLAFTGSEGESSALSGTLTVTDTSGSRTGQVTGTFTKVGDVLSSFSAENSDGTMALECE